MEALVRPRCILEDILKFDITETCHEFVDWIQLAQDRVQ
jgi:hypothetical protein